MREVEHAADVIFIAGANTPSPTRPGAAIKRAHGAARPRRADPGRSPPGPTCTCRCSPGPTSPCSGDVEPHSAHGLENRQFTPSTRTTSAGPRGGPAYTPEGRQTPASPPR
jgi:hypothetical protein